MVGEFGWKPDAKTLSLMSPDGVKRYEYHDRESLLVRLSDGFKITQRWADCFEIETDNLFEEERVVMQPLRSPEPVDEDDSPFLDSPHEVRPEQEESQTITHQKEKVSESPFVESAFEVHSSIARQILKKRKIGKMKVSTVLRIFHSLKLYNSGGSGRVKQKDYAQYADTSGIIKRRQLLKVLKAGESVGLWHRSFKKGFTTINLTSNKAVPSLLGMSKEEIFGGKMVKLPASCLKSVTQFERALISATHAGYGGKPMTRVSVKTLTSRSKKAQKRAERETGVEVEGNILILCPYTKENMHKAKFELNLAVFVYREKEKEYVAMMGGNTYHSKYKARKSFSQNRRLASGLLNYSTPTMNTDGMGSSAIEPRKAKLFYDNSDKRVSTTSGFWKKEKTETGTHGVWMAF